MFRCAGRAGLGELVNSLDGGLQARINENGGNFSGGEKQRIAIARALIKGADVLMLDEATSSLDNETVCTIEKFLLDLRELTCLVVTHRYHQELLRRYDEILVLRKGQIVEKGRFDELMDRKGYFYSLYNVGNEAGE